jgi:flagellar biosynthesis/type III secretory pathway protein FliH
VSERDGKEEGKEEGEEEGQEEEEVAGFRNGLQGREQAADSLHTRSFAAALFEFHPAP